MLLPRLGLALGLATALAATARLPGVDLRVDVGEAVAALRILESVARHQEPTADDWRALHESDGYRRLKRREAAMRRTFTDDEFDAFLRTDSVAARHAELARTLDTWQRRDAGRAAQQALEWLPPGARIRATISLLIKPRRNSFVFETSTDPAIMLYLDPAISGAEYTNRLTHELHHIGYASVCVDAVAVDKSPAGEVRRWLGAFGEGEAMLAAAGSERAHPQAVSPDSDRARWDHDVANFERDVELVQAFMRGVLDGQLTGEAIAVRAGGFYGVQGPWYTVGWKMSAVIVGELGRPAFIHAMCQPIDLLATYNRAAARRRQRTGERLATWDTSLLARLSPSR